MSSSNRLQVVWCEEASFGTLDTGATPQVMRITSESLAPEPAYIRNDEIRSDRQVTDVIRTDYGVSGDIGFNLSYSSHDQWFRRALMSDVDWPTQPTRTATDISASSVDNSLNITSGSFVTDGFLAGMWIKVSGFSGTTANNTLMKIVSVAAMKLIVEGYTLVSDAAGESVTILGASMITNGTTAKSFSLRKYAQEDSLYEYFVGLMIDMMSLSVTVGEKVSGTFGMVGKTNNYGDWGNANAATAATTTPIFQTVDHVPTLYEALTAMRFTEFTMELKNNLRQRKEVGYLGPQSIGSGTCSVTGSLKAYFKSTSQLAKVKADTATALSLRLRDSSNRNYFIDLPSVKLTKGGNPTPGQDTDIMADFSWEAYAQTAPGYTIALQRFATLA